MFHPSTHTPCFSLPLPPLTLSSINSVSNLGGTFPRFFVLKFVDAFTAATCIPPTSPPADLKGALITQAFSCVAEAEKHRCLSTLR